MQDDVENQAIMKAMFEDFRKTALNEKADGCINFKLLRIAKNRCLEIPAKDMNFFISTVTSMVREDCESGNIAGLFETANDLFDQPDEEERKEMNVNLIEYIPQRN